MSVAILTFCGAMTVAAQDEEPVEPATPANGQAYRVNGMPATDDTRGIIIQGNQKHLRK